ncbi:MAG: FtsX-like permease family protein, partial [Opitutus sp.]
FGIKLENHLAVSNLGRQIIAGNLEDFRNAPATGIMMGRVLADRLRVGVGDTVILRAADQQRRYKIAALYETGSSEIDRSRIFIWLGAIVLILGTIGGWAMGAGVTYGVSKMPIKIRGIFSADNFQVSWSIWHYLVATITAAVVVMTAAVVPARRAARLEPGDISRGTSQ